MGTRVQLTHSQWGFSWDPFGMIMVMKDRKSAPMDDNFKLMDYRVFQ